MSTAARICLTASGSFLLAGLLIGVWKYRTILASPRSRAPVYVDVAHRAALMYSFAALVMMALVEHSPYSDRIQIFAVSVPVFFFAAAIASYVFHGARGDTDNQFETRSFFTTWGMVLLIAGEVSGISILLWGFVVHRVL